MTSYPVRNALAQFLSANDARTSANAEEAKAANRLAYQALASVCAAYCEQFGRIKTEKWHPPEHFPKEAAIIFRRMIEGFLEGRVDQGLRDLLKRPGKPGPSLPEKNDIEDACRYMQAVEKEWISDSAPVARVSVWFGVKRSTAQSWLRRSRQRNLLRGFMPKAPPQARAIAITERAKVAGKRHSQYLAWRSANPGRM